MRGPRRSLDSCSSSSYPWTQGLKKSALVSTEKQYLRLPVESPGPALKSNGVTPNSNSWPCSSSEAPAMVPAKKTLCPVAPWGKTAVNAPPSPRKEALYHSPEAIKLQPPGTSNPTKSMQASSLFHKPYRVLRTLQCVTPISGTRIEDESIGSLPLRQQMSMDYCGNGDDSSSSCMSSIATAATVATQAPFSARLTQGMLQRHEKLAKGCPSHFAGDKLAKIVIRQKTQHELAKEQKKRSKDVSRLQSFIAEEDGHVEAVLVQGNDDSSFGGKRVSWLEEELPMAASAKGQRKQNEKQERIHEEQLRWAELERRGKLKAAELLRQRNLRAAELLHQSRLQVQDQPRDDLATLVKSMQSSREAERLRLVSPLTSRIQRTSRTLIDI